MKIGNLIRAFAFLGVVPALANEVPPPPEPPAHSGMGAVSSVPSGLNSNTAATRVHARDVPDRPHVTLPYSLALPSATQ
jgi:hypothetical protein